MEPEYCWCERCDGEIAHPAPPRPQRRRCIQRLTIPEVNGSKHRAQVS